MDSTQTSNNSTNSQQQGNGDMLDKGIDYAERKEGFEASHATTEKISDDVREGFTDTTGKDIPIQDKQYS